MKKTRSIKGLRTNIHEWSKGQGDFRTEDVKDAFSDGCVNIRLNNNRLAQLMRGNDSHEYNKVLKKWVKIRK